MNNEKALYEIAHALNRLTILKAIELHASCIREASGSTTDEAICNTSIYKAEYDFLENERSCASILDIVDDAEQAIISIAEETGVVSQVIQDSYEIAHK